MRNLLLPCMILCCVSAAYGARPMVTDDARLTDPGACQLETWSRFNRGSHENWALPACNSGGNLEVTAGGGYLWPSAGSAAGATLVQAKTLFRPLSENSYGVGFVGGYSTQPGQSHTGDVFAYVPTSLSWRDDLLVIHSNLGAIHWREKRQTRLTWGLGSEYRVNERFYLIAESFGQDRGSAFYQTGVRYWLLPNHLQIDATWGSSAVEINRDRWFSIGLRLITSSFLQ